MYTCIIIEDEQLARELIELYLSEFLSIQIIGCFENGQVALDFLKTNQVDLIISDIHMPLKNGLQLVKEVNRQAKVIFITAYAQYAVKGFELEVLDYIVKPFGLPRFRQSIDKFLKIMSIENSATIELEPFLVIKAGYNQTKILIKDIIYVSSEREYVKYHLENGSVMELKSLYSLEKILPKNIFQRIHRSYIVSKRHIQSLTNYSVIMSNNDELKIGNTYKGKITLEFE